MLRSNTSRLVPAVLNRWIKERMRRKVRKEDSMRDTSVSKEAEKGDPRSGRKRDLALFRAQKEMKFGSRGDFSLAAKRQRALWGNFVSGREGGLTKRKSRSQRERNGPQLARQTTQQQADVCCRGEIKRRSGLKGRRRRASRKKEESG